MVGTNIHGGNERRGSPEPHGIGEPRRVIGGAAKERVGCVACKSWRRFKRPRT